MLAVPGSLGPITGNHIVEEKNTLPCILLTYTCTKCTHPYACTHRTKIKNKPKHPSQLPVTPAPGRWISLVLTQTCTHMHKPLPPYSNNSNKSIYSCRWGNADLRRLATYSWINTWLLTGFPGFSGVLIFPSSTKLNIYARIDACIVKPVE